MFWIEVWLSRDFIQTWPGESSSWINASNSRYNGQKVNGKVVTVLKVEKRETLIRSARPQLHASLGIRHDFLSMVG